MSPGVTLLRVRTAAFIVLSLLIGCGGGNAPPPDNHGYGFAFDAASPISGLRVRYANDQQPRVDTLDVLYAGVAQCMAVTPAPPGPLVLLITDARLKGPSDGFTFLDTGTVVVDAQITTFDWTSTNPSIIHAKAFQLKHEFVHYLLSVTGFPVDRNVAHDSPFFDSCTI